MVVRGFQFNLLVTLHIDENTGIFPVKMELMGRSDLMCSAAGSCKSVTALLTTSHNQKSQSAAGLSVSC